MSPLESSKKSFFYTEELKPWELRTIIGYAIATIALGLFYFINNNETKKNLLLFYDVMTQLGLYSALYTSLRNLRSYLIWCGFGALHLIIYFLVRDNISLQMARGNAGSDLRNTIILLLLFQVLRFLSLKGQHRELLIPSNGGGKDLFENKSTSFLDFVLFTLYYGSWFGLSYLSFIFP